MNLLEPTRILGDSLVSPLDSSFRGFSHDFFLGVKVGSLFLFRSLPPSLSRTGAHSGGTTVADAVAAASCTML